MITRRTSRPAPRGAVIVVVIWAMAIASLVASAVMLLSYRQAILGQQTLARVQARWAARAGVEHTMAVMQYYGENTNALQELREDAYALQVAMENVAAGELFNSTYDIGYYSEIGGKEWPGPLDEHSRVNLNGDQAQQVLLQLDGMTFDTVDAIIDWRDDDDDERFQGAESDFYAGSGYQPRNGNYQNVMELEPVAGVWPEFVRGEDWNYNNRLDANEDDGDATNPPDNRDGQMLFGWGARFTAHTIREGATLTGEPRIWLALTDAEELAERLLVSPIAAQAIIDFANAGGENQGLGNLIFTPLENIDQSGRAQNSAMRPGAGGLMTPEQITLLFSETTTENPLVRRLGGININTVSRETLQFLFPEQELIADELIYLRDSQPGGITSLAQLQGVSSLTQRNIVDLAEVFTTTSNVYTISSRGRSEATGLEVEIIAVVDRSTLPVRILEYREQ